MRILVVEDDKFKRNTLKDILEKEDVELFFIKAINPALRYIHDNSSDIDGIILDLELPRFNSDAGINFIHLGGLDIPIEMTRLRLDIPIMINSIIAFTVDYEVYLKDLHNIKGKANPSRSNYKDTILSFIESIKKGEF